jgi:drug/metabolite transporter (DMT)-like permease
MDVIHNQDWFAFAAHAQCRHVNVVSSMSRETLGLILGVIGVVIFGATLPATRAAVADLAPWFVTMGRAALAGLLAACVLVLSRRRLPDRTLLPDLAIASSCIVVGFPGLIGLAMQTVPASHGGVVLGILPLATALFGAVFGGDRPSPIFWFWSVIGAALVVAFAIRDADMMVTLGDVYLFLSVFAAALGYVFSARLSRYMPGWEVISWAVVVALPLTIPMALWLQPSDWGSVRASSWIGFGYVAVFSMYLGFFPWNAGLAMGGVARVSQVQLLQTFVTLAVSAALLGESIDVTTIAFAVAVVGVVLLGRRAPIRQA